MLRADLCQTLRTAAEVLEGSGAERNQDVVDVIEMLTSAAEVVERADATVELCANFVEWCATRYPADVFPAEGSSKDAASGTALRLMLPRIAEELRTTYGGPLVTTGEDVAVDVSVVPSGGEETPQDPAADPAVV